ncbi:WhiB family transcriptional regulator [Mycobacterium intracellulare]|uniref:WhiB family transcriptional regulator n=1 Tax=Mycobacterium intracellulare TaxID=1767 RepID=UPI001EEE8E57|nr:WhiB family transcriptional regulator [Mycobacterium intracellulare]MEE3755250.1 WhiB family transcriptional regulator [Mycobacterium intracellulare]
MTEDPNQLSLFDEDDSREPDCVMAPVRPEGIKEPTRDNPAPCHASADPDVWTDESCFPELAPICGSCPFRQWCATEALDQASQGYHVVGMWAGIDFTETDRSGRYRRRIQKLEYIAATGRAPRTRRNRKSAA